MAGARRGLMTPPQSPTHWAPLVGRATHLQQHLAYDLQPRWGRLLEHQLGGSVRHGAVRAAGAALPAATHSSKGGGGGGKWVPWCADW